MSVVDELAHGIRTVRIGAVTDRVQEVGHGSEPALSVFLDAGVVLRSDRTDNHNQLGSDLDKYQLVRQGDLVFNRLRTWQGGFGASRHRGIVSPAYIVARPRSGNARYLDYVLHSAPYLAELTRISKWMPPSQFDVLWADLRNVLVPWPSAEEQRRIADFLDDRVARIDQIITARRQQVAALHAAVDSDWDALDTSLRQTAPLVPIRRVLRSIVDGPFGSSLTSSHYTDAGVRVIRLGNIGKAEFRDADKAYIDTDYGRQLAGHGVASGDLLMAGLGDEKWPLGRCVVAPSHLGPAIVKADCYRIRLDSRVSHSFAACYLSGPASRSAFMQLARGATRARLNTALARAAELPLVDSARQAAYVEAVHNLKSSAQATTGGMDASTGFLQEYKQSLITAAVTGDLDVTTAGSGVPG